MIKTIDISSFASPPFDAEQSPRFHYCSDNNHHYILCNRKRYESPAELTADFPSLPLESPPIFCNLVNYLATGNTYHVIESAHDIPPHMPPPLKPSLKYDTREIAPPSLNGDDLIFYAYDEHSHTPRKVTYSLNDSTPTYSLLAEESPPLYNKPHEIGTYRLWKNGEGDRRISLE